MKHLQIMVYNGIELSALVKLGLIMAQADGHVDDVEQEAIAHELASFGVDMNSIKTIVAGAAALDPSKAIIILSAMTNEQKKYACGYLAAIMAADGDIDEKEVKVWQVVCTLGSFPKMNIGEALEFWTKH